MLNSITIRIPQKMQKELDSIVKDERMSKSDFIREALQRYLSIKRFRQLRKKVLPFAENQGLLTDEDVFNLLK